MTGWTTDDMTDQTGRYCVVTGATGGLGLETAKALAAAGADVLLTGRDAAKGGAALVTVRAAYPAANVDFALCDLASLTAVNAFADTLIAAGRPVDILINNAGIMALPKRELTEDGFEAQLGVNVIGHYLLTARFMPLLRAAPAPRVVQLASLAHRMGRIFLDDLAAEARYNKDIRYAQSKLAMLIFALELQRRSDAGGWGVTSLAAHPGLAATDLFRHGASGGLSGRLRTAALNLFSQSGTAGAWPTLMAATAPDVKPGGYYGPTGFMETKGKAGPAFIGANARNTHVAAQLWDRLAAMSGAVWPNG